MTAKPPETGQFYEGKRHALGTNDHQNELPPESRHDHQNARLPQLRANRRWQRPQRALVALFRCETAGQLLVGDPPQPD